MTLPELADLAEPDRHQEPIDIAGQPPDRLISQLRTMIRIRMAEQHLARMRQQGLIGGPVHLGVGQEAVAAGVSGHLRRTDKVFGGHRSHSHLLALGASLHGLFAEVLGKETGLSRGMGGSMHLWDAAHGFHGSVPIVAGTVPLAVGAGLAAKLQGRDDVGVCYFGDGATEEGVVHESLNLARTLTLPVLFVVENNFFSSHMEISLRQPLSATARFAAAHDVEFEVVDGNDVVAVWAAAGRLVERARSGRGPGFLEAVTYRWYGHVDWREDIDVGLNRSADKLERWRGRDPVGRLVTALQGAGLWSADDYDRIVEEIAAEIREAWERAASDPWPPPAALLDRVYARPKDQ